MRAACAGRQALKAALENEMAPACGDRGQSEVQRILKTLTSLATPIASRPPVTAP